MKHSKLSEHTKVKKGLVPPFMSGEMGKLVELSSWSKDRMPEYIWLGLLRDSVERKEFFVRMSELINYTRDNFEEDVSKFSNILRLDGEKKDKLFKEIKRLFGNNILDPLLIVSNFDRDFRDAFFDSRKTNDERIEKIEDIVKKMYDRYEKIAIDIRFIIIFMRAKDIHIAEGLTISEIMERFPLIESDSPEMGMYSTLLSSLEIAISSGEKSEYSDYFFNQMYHLSECKPCHIEYTEICNKEIIREKIEKINDLLRTISEKEYNDKLEVISGNLCYISKMIKDIYENDMETSIISRLVMRVLVEVYINLKFLLSEEKNEEKIWSAYKDYGAGKYKAIYKKIEEGISTVESEAHINEDVLRLFTNEVKNEEFIIINFKNFADKSIREKFDSVSESNLYNTYYDYDSCYTHGYWSAVRESSCLTCNNPSHNYHLLPDIDNDQKLRNIYNDYSEILEKIINLVEKEIKE